MGLNDIDDLESVASIGGDLILTENALIKEVDSLKQLAAVGGSIEIHNNNTLKDVDGLDGLSEVNGTLSISGNDKLTSLYGLRLITYVAQDLVIKDNPDLSWCEVETMVETLSNADGVGGSIIRGGNLELDDCDEPSSSGGVVPMESN